MKTAMQELIEFVNTRCLNGDFVLEKANQLLQQEKEQILKAHINGQSEFDMLKYRDINKILSENYYDQNYNL